MFLDLTLFNIRLSCQTYFRMLKKIPPSSNIPARISWQCLNLNHNTLKTVNMMIWFYCNIMRALQKSKTHFVVEWARKIWYNVASRQGTAPPPPNSWYPSAKQITAAPIVELTFYDFATSYNICSLVIGELLICKQIFKMRNGSSISQKEVVIPKR